MIGGGDTKLMRCVFVWPFFLGGGGDSLEVDGMICLLFFFCQFGRLLSNDVCRGFHGNMWKVDKVFMYSMYVYIYIYIYPLHHNSIFVDGTSRHSVNMLILIVLLKQVFSIKNEIR